MTSCSEHVTGVGDDTLPHGLFLFVVVVVLFSMLIAADIFFVLESNYTKIK
jgi:hypothetical protein